MTLNFNDEGKLNQVLVIPPALNLIWDAVSEQNPQKLGTIDVEFEKQQVDDDAQEFDEQEQLYIPKTTEHVESNQVPLYQLTTSKGNVALVAIPIFKDKIVYNLIAAEILRNLAGQYVILGTSEVGEPSLQKLSNDSSIDIPDMQPPSVLTGVGGAFSARAAFEDVPFITLAVDSEGAFTLDTEKPNLDAVLSLSKVLVSLLGLDKSFVASVQQRITRKRANAGGLYL